jgi:heavy metal sensor kinase
MTLTLRTRLTVFYAGIFAVLLAALAAVSYRALAQQLDSDATANLDELTNGLHGYIHFDDGLPEVSFDRTDPEEAAFVQRATRFYQIYDATTGALVAQSDALEPLGLTFTPDEVKSFHDQPRMHDIQTDYGRIRLSNSVIAGDKGKTYLLQVGGLLAANDAALRRYLQLLLWGVPGGLFIAVLAGIFLSGFVLTPLSRLAAATRAIDVRNLQHRLPLRGVNDELDEVARAFNDALARVEHTVGEMRQFSTAIAHELRTPIAALRGEIELAAMRAGLSEADRSAAFSQLEELDKLKRLIEQLLTLARAESGEIPLARQPVELGALIASVCDQVEAVAHAKGLGLRSEINDGAVVAGDPAWLERALLNLLDNAFKFTPPGGSVLVRLTSAGDSARMEVRDSGIGMPTDVVPHVFERFYRADPARSATEGVGLGLSLVKWIVDRHNGTIEATGGAPGQGSVFTIYLKKI